MDGQGLDVNINIAASKKGIPVMESLFFLSFPTTTFPCYFHSKLSCEKLEPVPRKQNSIYKQWFEL